MFFFLFLSIIVVLNRLNTSLYLQNIGRSLLGLSVEKLTPISY